MQKTMSNGPYPVEVFDCVKAGEPCRKFLLLLLVNAMVTTVVR